MVQAANVERQYWLWVTRPEHYLDENGEDSEFLDPSTGATGRQYICRGNGGRIDLLCYDRRRWRYVVIELKNARATYHTFGQISSYIGWVKQRIAGRRPVVGLVISRGADARFEASLRTNRNVTQLNISDLGFA
jgi:RecB family endonuclease NucS